MRKSPSKIQQYSYSYLWLMEHFIGSKWLAQKRKNVSINISKSIEHSSSNLLKVPSLENLSIDDFIKSYRNKLQPVVFKGLAKTWPAFNKWSPSFFAEQYASDPVILFDASIENLKTRNFESAKIKNFKDYIIDMENGSKEYARFLPLLDQHEELKRDFDIDWLKHASGHSNKNVKNQLFIGGKDTSTSIHSAIGSNLFVQLYGRKKWWIYSTEYSPLIEPVVDRSIFFRSFSNAENPTGNFKNARGWEIVLEPGDVLFNPPFYWHQVRNLDTTIGVGYRWFSLSSILKSSLAQLIMTITASNPGLRTIKKLNGNFARVYEQVLSKSLKE